MRKNIFFMALLAIVMLGVAACANKPTEDNGVNNFRIRRGTNLSHWLSQSEERGEARKLHIQEDDFERLEQLGFDFVRIPIDEVQFWDEEGNKLPEAWELLTNALDLAQKHHLRAIVDLHIIRSHYFNAVNEGDKQANTLFTSEKAQDDLIGLWYQLSEALKGYSNDSVAYEFMNEPVADEHEQWNQLVAKVHAALRKVEPQRTLVIGSNKWQGYETMKYLRVPENDITRAIIEEVGTPLICTSVRPLGEEDEPENYCDPELIHERFESRVDVVVDAAPAARALHHPGMECREDQGRLQGRHRGGQEIQPAALLRRVGCL